MSNRELLRELLKYSCSLAEITSSIYGKMNSNQLIYLNGISSIKVQSGLKLFSINYWFYEVHAAF